MSFFRGDRALSHFLRHDPFSPFTRPSISPFYSPFFSFFDEPRGRYYDHSPHPQPALTQTSSKSSPSHHSDSSHSNSQSSPSSHEVTRTSGDDSQPVERRHRRHRGGRQEAQQPLSVLGGSPFTGSAWPSLFNAALSPFAPLTAAVRAIPDISVDVHSTPQSYAIHANVPGLEKEDIRVTVDDGVLTIEAERRESRSRQPPINTANSSAANADTASASSASTSAASASAPSSSSTGGESGAEMKEESKESTDEKTAAPSSSSPSSTSASTTGANTSATSTTSSANGGSAMEEDPEDFHYTEMYYGRAERSIQLPEDAKVDELTAKYENGVLKIDIPRVQEQKMRGRRIEIQ